MTSNTVQSTVVNSNTTHSVPVSSLGIWAATKLVFVTICNVLIGICTVANKSVKSLDDIATVANISTNQMVREASINAEAQIAQLALNPDLSRS